MFKTRVTEKLAIEHPIIIGAMANISNPNFVAAAAEAGCLGILASTNYKSEKDFTEAIKRTKSLTINPFGVNISTFPARTPVNNAAYLKILTEERIKVVETSGFGIPDGLLPMLAEAQGAGVTWIHKCTGLRYARKAVSLGADMVTVVGYENGGATGKLDIGTFVLIPSVARALNVPIIGGGGVTNGAGLVAALALGAEAVIMGTAFLVSEECPIHVNLKKALLEADTTDTVLAMRSIGNTHRYWRNEKIQQIIELESHDASKEEIIQAASGENNLSMYQTGDLSKGLIACGQGIGMVTEIKTIKNIVSDIIAEAKSVNSKIYMD